MEEELQHKILHDAGGNLLEGGMNYLLHLPPGIPASNFWSIVVYDNENHLIIRTDQPWPSVHSQLKRLHVEEDGSVEVWFGPAAQSGRANNWVKTIPGKVWYLILRLYYPTESWFNNSWRPGKLNLLSILILLSGRISEIVWARF